MKYTQVLLLIVAIISASTCNPCQEQIQNLISQQGCQDLRECFIQLKQTLNFQCLSYLYSQFDQYKLSSPKKTTSYVLNNPSKDELAVLNQSSQDIKKLKINVQDFHYEGDSDNVNLNFSNLGSFVNLEKFYLSIKVNSVNKLKGMEFLQTSTKLSKIEIHIDAGFNQVTLTEAMQLIEQLTTLEELNLDIGTSIWSNQLDLSKLTNLYKLELFDQLKVNIVGLAQLTKLNTFHYQIGERFAQYQAVWQPQFLYDLEHLTSLKHLSLFIDDKAGINDFGFFRVFKNLPQITILKLALGDITYCANIYPQVQERRCQKPTKLKNLQFLSNIAYLTSLEKLNLNIEENDQVIDFSPLELGIFPLENLLELNIYAPYNSKSSLDTGITKVKYSFDKKYKGHLDKYSFKI